MEVNSGLAEKTALAVTVIEEALQGGQGTLAVYLSDMPGLVLLHLLKMAGKGRISVPVVNVQFRPMPKEALCFVDKLRRMWALDLDVERPPMKPGGFAFTEDEMSGITRQALIRRGACRVVSSKTGSFEGGAYSSGRVDYVEFRPLYGFAGDDILEYADIHRLPICSLDKKAVEGQVEAAEDAAVREKLKMLGYI